MESFLLPGGLFEGHSRVPFQMNAVRSAFPECLACRSVRPREMQQMIRQLGVHAGKQIVFGFDRYLLQEVDDYREVLLRYGEVEIAVDYDYLHYLSSAQKVCEQVQLHTARVGILVCGTGMGMSIAANKFRGVYASRCLSVEDAQMARTINNSNVLCLASKSGLATNMAIIAEFMSCSYDGRKLEQLECITQLELESHPGEKLPALRVPHELRQSA